MRAERLAVRSIELDERPDLVSFLRSDGHAWIHEHEGFVAWGEVERIDPGTGPGRFERAQEMLHDVFRRIETDATGGTKAPLAIGAFTFDPARAGSALVIPRFVVETHGGRAWITSIGEEPPDVPPRFARTQARLERVRYSGSSLSEIGWLDAVARATDAIERGEFGKVVLARDIHVWSETAFDLAAIVGRLALRFAGCFTFLTDGLVGASPERLIQRSGRRVRSTVLAGSAQRGSGNSQDAELGRALLASEKEANEHRFAVESVHRVLDAVCSWLQVEGPHLLRLANVQHLATEFVGELNDDLSALQIAGKLHPTAAVGGTPRAAALRFIDAAEGLDRGRYTGPVGWVDRAGDGEWAIALRCAELEGTRGRLFAGGGIVAGSLPEAELEETRLKFRAMESVLGDP